MSAEVLLPQLNLRRPQIAFVLNIPLQQVDQLIQSGELPSFKIGGTRLARCEDVKAFNDKRFSDSQTVHESKDVDDAGHRSHAPEADTSQAHATIAPVGARAELATVTALGGKRKGARHG